MSGGDVVRYGFDRQGHVDRAGVTEERCEPTGTDLAREAGHGKRLTPLIADLHTAREHFDRVGAEYPTRSWLGLRSSDLHYVHHPEGGKRFSASSSVMSPCTIRCISKS